MIPNGILAAALLVFALPAFGQPVALDPPITKEEQQLLADLQKEYRKSGLAPMSEDQAARTILNLRQKQAEMMGAMLAARQVGKTMSNLDEESASAIGRSVLAQSRTGMPAVSTPLVPTVPATPAENLLAAISRQRSSAAPVQFGQRREGFTYNGRAMVDAAGEITDYGSNAMTGDVCYLVTVAPGQQVLKYKNVNSQLPPVPLGRVIDDGNMVTLQLATGDSVTGRVLIPTSEGAIVVRPASMVIYEPANGAQATAIPDGFSVADLQNGDVAGTGYLLIERDGDAAGPESNNPFERIKKAGSMLSNVFKETAYDYALFNPSTGQSIPLNVPLRGKEVAQMYNCRRQNSLVNKCSGMSKHASLWNNDGDRNWRHYYWAITWFNTPRGPLAVAMENGSQVLSVIQMSTGKKVTAFEHMLGIATWKVEQTPQGTTRLAASWNFKDHVIDDIQSVIDGDAPKAD